jgi:hypothetical protein
MPVSWPMYFYAKRLDKPSALRPKVCGTPSLPSPLYFIYTPNLPILYYGSQSQLSLLLSTTSTPESSLLQLPLCSRRRKTQENNLVFTLGRVLTKPKGIIIQLRINLSIMISIKPKKTNIVIHVRIPYQGSRQYFNGASLKAHLFDKSMRKNRFILAMIPFSIFSLHFERKFIEKIHVFH